jgi:hypothetical protein
MCVSLCVRVASTHQEWHRHNDSSVRAVTLGNVFDGEAQSAAYMLFYTAHGPPRRPVA